jgi:DNA polymerase-3 subunit gamma/tau
VKQLTEALAAALGTPLKVEFRAAPGGDDTLHARSRRDQDARQQEAERAFTVDPAVQRLLNQYEGRIVPGSVRPLDAP